VHDETVAQDYYAAMAVIEKQLELQMPAEISAESNRNQHKNDDNDHRLLALVDALAAGELDDRQRRVVDELRSSIVALAG